MTLLELDFQSPSESLRASIQELQGSKPEDAAMLQQQLVDVEQLEAEDAAMDKDFAAKFPADPTRDDVLAAIARRESPPEKNLTEMDFTDQNLEEFSHDFWCFNQRRRSMRDFS